jgi:hypothetical protein
VIKFFRGVLLAELVTFTLAMLIACIFSSVGLASGAVMSPIRHVIVIVGENHSFDNLFGAYRPNPSTGQSVMNLLSEGIINPDGTPGPHFTKAEQWQAVVKDKYSIAPARTVPYARLPQPNTPLPSGSCRACPTRDFRRTYPMVHSSSVSTPPISFHTLATRLIASSRCGSSTMRAATTCSSGTL